MSEGFLTLEDIAKIVGGEVNPAHGDPGTSRIRRVGVPHSARADTLVFAEDKPSLQAALASMAGAVLARHAGENLPHRVVRVADPRYAFALCAQHLARRSRQDHHANIHPSAIVDATAKLGAGVQIGAGAVIEANATLGDDTQIGSHAVVGRGVLLGARVVVQAGAVLGATGFGYVRNRDTGEYLLCPQQGALIIEDDVEIGANTTVDRGALEETRIGRGTKIDNLVHIGHNCRIGQNVIIAAQVGISGSCTIEDGAILAGQVGLSDHCHIGPGVILGGQAGVYRGKTVQGPGEVFAGTPAEPLREHMRSLARLRRLR